MISNKIRAGVFISTALLKSPSVIATPCLISHEIVLAACDVCEIPKPDILAQMAVALVTNNQFGTDLPVNLYRNSISLTAKMNINQLILPVRKMSFNEMDIALSNVQHLTGTKLNAILGWSEMYISDGKFGEHLEQVQEMLRFITIKHSLAINHDSSTIVRYEQFVRVEAEFVRIFGTENFPRNEEERIKYFINAASNFRKLRHD